MALALGEGAVALHQVNGGVLQQLAGVVHDRALAAGALARIDAEHAVLAERCGQQELAQVLGEDVDGAGVALHLELHAHVDFDRRHQQPIDAVTYRLLELAGPGRAAVERGVFLAELHERRLVEIELHAQDALALAAADGQVAVRGNGADRLGEVRVGVELGHLLGVIGGLADGDRRLLHVHLACVFAHLGVFSHALGADVARACQRRADVRHFFLRADEGLRGFAGDAFERLRPEQLRQRLEPALPRDHRARTTLGLVRQVQIFELGLGGHAEDLLLELRRELALLLDLGEHALASGLELDQVGATLLDVPDLHLVEAARRFFAIARDEGHRGALGQELDHRGYRHRRQRELGGDRRNGIERRSGNGHRSVSVSRN